MSFRPCRQVSAVPTSAFKGFRFPAEIILLAVRWYLRYGLSYRDVKELVAERGVEVDHVTVFRWVQCFTPILADAARPCRHTVGNRWFVDETYVRDLCEGGRPVALRLPRHRSARPDHRRLRVTKTRHHSSAKVLRDRARRTRRDHPWSRADSEPSVRVAVHSRAARSRSTQQCPGKSFVSGGPLGQVVGRPGSFASGFGLRWL